VKRKRFKPAAHSSIRITVYDEPVEITFETPSGDSTPRRMLPVFRKACNSVVGAAVRFSEKHGRTVSCAAGCGACCRQMVPISPTEARLLKDIFDSLTPERREVIAERFRSARAVLEENGLIGALEADEKPTGPEYKDLALKYFRLGIPCPFLENESCSIHAERPLVCREYLVVSPPENCARTNGQPVEVIKIPGEASKALTALEGEPGFRNWVPLSLSLDWAALHPEDDVPRPALEIAKRFFSSLTRSDL